MFSTLFKRAAATGAVLVAVGSAAALNLPSAGAATARPAVSQSVKAAQAHTQAAYWCHYGYYWRWCPYPWPPRPWPPWPPRPWPPWPPWPHPLPEASMHYHGH